MRKIALMITFCLTLFAKDIMVFENEYNLLLLEKKVEKLIIGSKEIVNVSVLSENKSLDTLLKLFGKKSGNTSILVFYRDKSIENYHVYVNQNLGYIQKMINVLEPKVFLSRVGNASTVISGEFSDPHQKKRVYSILENAGVDIQKLMDITQTKKVNKMIRTKLYLVEIDNQKAKELGGATGLGFFGKHGDINLNANAPTGATFSGFLLDNFRDFSTQTGKSVVGTLNFLEDKGIAKILDDTVLLTTEDKNASFRVGGEVYIPTGIRENGVGFPTIELEEKEYGLSLVLKTYFMEKDNFMHMDIEIEDSEFDNTASHNVQLGEFTTVPSFVSKNIKTDIVAQSGQIIALGGRLHKEEYNQEQKIPLLGDIPLLGELFKRKISGSKENDLIFFLVPEIVDANENIDDTYFYRDFKNSGNELHKNILDINNLKFKSDIKAKVNPQEESMLYEIKGDIAQEEDSSSQNIEIISEEDIQVKEQPFLEAESLRKELVKEDENRSILEESRQQKKVVKKQENIKMYAVASKKIFVREKPIDGRRNSVWLEGHKFTISEIREYDNSVWLKIKEDCYKECSFVEKELWIAQKYTKEL